MIRHRHGMLNGFERTSRLIGARNHVVKQTCKCEPREAIDVALSLLPTRHRLRCYAKEGGEIFRLHSDHVPNKTERSAIDIASAHERLRDIELQPIHRIGREVDLAALRARDCIDDSSDVLFPDTDLVFLCRCLQRFRSAIRACLHHNGFMTATN